MGDTDLVSKASTVDGSRTNSTAMGQHHAASEARLKSSSESKIKITRSKNIREKFVKVPPPKQLICVRDVYVNKGISVDVADFMLGAWRDGTQKNYGCYLTKWSVYCKTKNIDFLHPNIGEVLDYLYEGFQSGLSYSALNTIRSSLSKIIRINNVPVGQDVSVCQFMRAVSQCRPALPRNNVTWSINKVLDYLNGLGPSEDLSVELLTKKLVMLLAVLSGVRGQSIFLWGKENMSLTDDRVAFRIGDPTKTSRPGKHVPEIVYLAFPNDKNVCVVNTLQVYIRKTESRRRKDVKQLILTHGKPHGPAARSTITRWLKEIMVAAGIDMNMFTAHSVRAAAVSSVSSRLPLATILKTGGWTSESTYSRFYKKPIVEEGALQVAIMTQRKRSRVVKK